MSAEKKHFEEWKAKTYASEKAHEGDIWDSGHNVGLENGLNFAFEYSELVSSERITAIEKKLDERNKEMGLNIKSHLADMEKIKVLESKLAEYEGALRKISRGCPYRKQAEDCKCAENTALIALGLPSHEQLELKDSDGTND